MLKRGWKVIKNLMPLILLLPPALAWLPHFIPSPPASRPPAALILPGSRPLVPLHNLFERRKERQNQHKANNNFQLLKWMTSFMKIFDSSLEKSGCEDTNLPFLSSCEWRGFSCNTIYILLIFIRNFISSDLKVGAELCSCFAVC